MEQFLNLLISTVKQEESLIDEDLIKGKYQESNNFKKCPLGYLFNLFIYFSAFEYTIKLSSK